MKEKELRRHAVCSLCKKKVLVSRLPFFYRLRIERFGVDVNAVKRQTGLTMMLNGHAGLALAMGTDEEMAIPLMDTLVLVVCEACSVATEPFCVAHLAEIESTVEEL